MTNDPTELKGEKLWTQPYLLEYYTGSVMIYSYFLPAHIKYNLGFGKNQNQNNILQISP